MRDTVDCYVRLSFSHMVVDSCWGHHCWSLNLAQLTGYAHTPKHTHTNWLRLFFLHLGGLCIDLHSFIKTCPNPNQKPSLYPKHFMVWLFVPKWEAGPQIYDFSPHNVSNTKSFILQILHEHTLKLILPQMSYCCQTHTHIHTSCYVHLVRVCVCVC